MDPDNRDFLKLVRDTEAAIAALLGVLGTKLVSIITDKSRRGRSTQRELIDRVIRQYVESYRLIVTEAVANSGGLQADKNTDKLLPLLLKAGAEQEREYMRGRFSGYREEIRRRFPTQRHPEDLKTFEQRVRTVRTGFQRTVYKMVQRGVDEGIDPRKMAALIQDAVVMTPAQTAREAARLRQRSDTANRGAPSGSIQYNSMRIARTEMATIYRRSVTDFYDDRPYKEGYDWVLSNRHAKIDRCNEYAARSPYRRAADLPQPHPNCLCRTVARVMSQAEIKRLIASGRLA